MSRKLKKKTIFAPVITDSKRTTLLKTALNNTCSFKNSLNLFFVEALFVHDLPPLVFKRFSTILHFSVMTQMILALINTFQILNINLLMNLKF